MSRETELFLRFAVALAVGLLIGLERGWQERDAAPGSRVAGMRTMALLALLGAMWGLISEEVGAVVLGFAVLAVAILVSVAQVVRVVNVADSGITTAVAALLTFVLGAASIRGHVAIVVVVAVVAATILGIKPVLHRWVERLERRELYGILEMLLISVVLLSVLPNRGYGPWEALNPYEIWWMVVLIAGISFCGYFAIKLAGTERGLAVTAFFGGLASSTAVTLNYSRLGREAAALHRTLAAGVLVAAGTMFPRTLLLAGILYAPLVPALAAPLTAMMVVCYLAAWRCGRRGREDAPAPAPAHGLRNPFELWTAVQFGVLLAVIMVLARALQHGFGDAGIYLLAALSGLSDVDAVTLSMSRMSGHELPVAIAARAIALAAIVNTMVKGLLAVVIAGGEMARLVGVALAIAVLAGVASLAVTWPPGPFSLE